MCEANVSSPSSTTPKQRTSVDTGMLTPSSSMLLISTFISCTRVTDKLSFICVQFQSIRRHPSTDFLNAPNHPGIHDMSSGGISRTVELDIISIRVRIEAMTLSDLFCLL